MSVRSSLASKLQHNLQDVLEHGPRLSYNRHTWILAKDPEVNRVFLGGLGGMGVGRMWLGDGGYLADPEYREAPTVRMLDPENPFSDSEPSVW